MNTSSLHVISSIDRYSGGLGPFVVGLCSELSNQDNSTYVLTKEKLYKCGLNSEGKNCLYFLYSIIKSISLGYEIDVAADYLSNNCMRPAENLLLIKSFAKYVYDNFLNEDKPLEMEFSLIFLPKFIQDNELKAYDLMQIPDWDDIESE